MVSRHEEYKTLVHEGYNVSQGLENEELPLEQNTANNTDLDLWTLLLGCRHVFAWSPGSCLSKCTFFSRTRRLCAIRVGLVQASTPCKTKRYR